MENGLDNGTCETCDPNGLKVRKVNGVTQIEVSDDFLGAKLGRTEQQITQALMIAERSGRGELSISPGVGGTGRGPGRSEHARSTEMGLPQSNFADQFTFAESDVASVLGHATSGRSVNFTLAETDAQDVLGFSSAQFSSYTPPGLPPKDMEKARKLLRKHVGGPYERLRRPLRDWIEALLAYLLGKGKGLRRLGREGGAGIPSGTKLFEKPDGPIKLGTEDNCATSETLFLVPGLTHDFAQIVDVRLWVSDPFLTPSGPPEKWSSVVRTIHQQYLDQCAAWEAYFNAATVQLILSMLNAVHKEEGWSLDQLQSRIETEFEDYECISPCRKYVTILRGIIKEFNENDLGHADVICERRVVYPPKPKPGEQTYSVYEVRLRWEKWFLVSGNLLVSLQCKQGL